MAQLADFAADGIHKQETSGGRLSEQMLQFVCEAPEDYNHKMKQESLHWTWNLNHMLCLEMFQRFNGNVHAMPVLATLVTMGLRSRRSGGRQLGFKGLMKGINGK